MFYARKTSLSAHLTVTYGLYKLYFLVCIVWRRLEKIWWSFLRKLRTIRSH